MTNVKMVHEIATELVASGYSLGKAAPIAPYRGNNRMLVGIAALALPSIFVLLLGFFGIVSSLARGRGVRGDDRAVRRGRRIASRHARAFADRARGRAALCDRGVPFADPRASTKRRRTTLGAQLLRSVGWTLIAIVVALAGALVVVGLMSTPLAMEEIERFRGVKLVLAVPPLLALAACISSPPLSAAKLDAAHGRRVAGAAYHLG